MARMPRLVVLALFLTLGLAGCSSDDDGGSSPSAAPRPVEFTGGDGEPRQGRLYGPDDAPAAVVLSHMSRAGDSWDDWSATAEALAARGHRVLTYERLRPRFQIWQDVIGGVEYLRDQGAERVVVAGASLGAMASLDVALASSPPTDGVVWVAGGLRSDGMEFDQASVTGLGCPALLITGDADGYGVTEDTQQLHEWLPASELLVLPTGSHGTDILADGGAPAEQLQTAILDFVDAVATAQASTPC